MVCFKIKFKHRGFLLTEAIVCIALLAVISGVASKVLYDYCRTRNHHLCREAVLLAADGQLQRYQAGAALNSKPPAGLISDGIELGTSVEPGLGQWQGFDKVTVKASVLVGGKDRVSEQVVGYVRSEVGR